MGFLGETECHYGPASLGNDFLPTGRQIDGPRRWRNAQAQRVPNSFTSTITLSSIRRLIYVTLDVPLIRGDDFLSQAQINGQGDCMRNAPRQRVPHSFTFTIILTSIIIYNKYVENGSVVSSGNDFSPYHRLKGQRRRNAPRQGATQRIGTETFTY